MTSSKETEFDAGVVEALRSRVGEYLEGSKSGRGVRVGIVCGRFNGGITTRLLNGALKALEEGGVDRSDISLGWVPGAFEIPMMALAYADGGNPVDVVITLGAGRRVKTSHYEVVAGECARGVQDVQLSTRVPVIFGVLTVNTIEQALERSKDDETNVGYSSATTALEMVSILNQGSVADQ